MIGSDIPPWRQRKFPLRRAARGKASKISINSS
jgi:hypothetical protein